MIRFMTLASGSSGNCFYIATSRTALLIDAGIGVRTIKKRLKDYGASFSSVNAVLITHDHVDHIKSVYGLGELCYLPVYATQKTHIGINQLNRMQKLLTAARVIRKEEPMEIGDFRITAFEVPHDASDNVGYFIEAEGKCFCFITDIGHVTPVCLSYITKANYLVLEANYDEEMLRNGPYPEDLKRRIIGANGHLSNAEAAECISSNYSPQLKSVWLCHISKENNTPELAFRTVADRLKQRDVIVGQDIQLVALKRGVPSELYTIP